MTRILIADDHEVVRSGLRKILESQSKWEVVGEASDGKEAVAKALELKPDIAVLDYGLPTLPHLPSPNANLLTIRIACRGFPGVFVCLSDAIRWRPGSVEAVCLSSSATAAR